MVSQACCRCAFQVFPVSTWPPQRAHSNCLCKEGKSHGESRSTRPGRTHEALLRRSRPRRRRHASTYVAVKLPWSGGRSPHMLGKIRNERWTRRRVMPRSITCTRGVTCSTRRLKQHRPEGQCEVTTPSNAAAVTCARNNRKPRNTKPFIARLTCRTSRTTILCKRKGGVPRPATAARAGGWPLMLRVLSR